MKSVKADFMAVKRPRPLKSERREVMNSEELVKLMAEIDAKGIGWDKVEEKIKVPHSLLKLYANSGPVPVTIINKLKKFLEAQPN
jgi:hypothetical protein